MAKTPTKNEEASAALARHECRWPVAPIEHDEAMSSPHHEHTTACVYFLGLFIFLAFQCKLTGNLAYKEHHVLSREEPNVN